MSTLIDSNGVYCGPSTYIGDLDLSGCTSLTSLGLLKEVGGSLYLRDCISLTSLGALEKVVRWLDLRGCTSLTSLGLLKEVAGSLDLRDCISLTSLGALEKVVGSLDLRGCISLTSLGALEKVTGSVILSYGNIISFEDFKKELGAAELLPLEDLPRYLTEMSITSIVARRKLAL